MVLFLLWKDKNMSQTENRHLPDRLIRIIETDAEELAQGMIKQLQTSPRTPSYHKLSYGELHDRAYAVYHDLGRWLWEKSDRAIQDWYNGLGEKRYSEGIPLAEVLWALVLTKNRLTDYLGKWGLADSAIELYQQQEFDRLVGHFFDRAVCYAAEGYEHQASIQSRSGTETMAH
jgi:hypothetical protein